MKHKVRLECYKLALAMKKRNSDLLQDTYTLAKDFANFCDGFEVRLDSLLLAFETSDRRAKLEEILESASIFVRFAEGKPQPEERPKKPPLHPKPKRKKLYKTSTRSR